MGSRVLETNTRPHTVPIKSIKNNARARQFNRLRPSFSQPELTQPQLAARLSFALGAGRK